jgi:hypothetical protein
MQSGAFQPRIAPPIGAPIYAQAGSVEPTPADAAVLEFKAPAGSNRRTRLSGPRTGGRMWLVQAGCGGCAPVRAPVTPVERAVFGDSRRRSIPPTGVAASPITREERCRSISGPLLLRMQSGVTIGNLATLRPRTKLDTAGRAISEA